MQWKSGPRMWGRSSVTYQPGLGKAPAWPHIRSRSLLTSPFEGLQRWGVPVSRVFAKQIPVQPGLAFISALHITSSFHLLHVPGLPSQRFFCILATTGSSSRLKTRKVVVVVKVRMYDSLLQLAFV